jgi:site-specific DNA-cytosine methylase
MTLRLLSLCSGIGVIDYVWSHLLGQEIAGQVEINPYCYALLMELVIGLNDRTKMLG